MIDQDPRPTLDGVYENIDKTLRLKADYSEAYQIRADAHLIAASYALGRGGDVDGEVSQGLQALADRAKHSPNDARDETLRTQLILVRARWLVQKGKLAGVEWKQALESAERALKIDAEEPAVRLAHAELVRYIVELSKIENKAAEKLIGQELNVVEYALRQQPWNNFLQAAQAALWLMRGRTAREPAAQRRWQDRGKMALSLLLQQNHLLKKEYGGLIDQIN